jgi:hypothetical protein
VFEITHKEQLLKNVRKSIVQPLPNVYPLIDLDSQVVKKPLFKSDESFIKTWVERGYLFAVYNGYHDLIKQIMEVCENYNLGLPAITDKFLLDILTENEIPYYTINQLERTLCSGFSKLEVTTNTLYFSTEIHPLKEFSNCENLILFGKANQIENPENNKYFCELLIKNDIKVQLPIDYFSKLKSVFLFIEE